jgi:hypothetical protein
MFKNPRLEKGIRLASTSGASPFLDSRMSHSSPPTSQPPQPVPPSFSALLIAGDGPNIEFDEALGSYMGIPAMSNRDDGFFSGERWDMPTEN